MNAQALFRRHRHPIRTSTLLRHAGWLVIVMIVALAGVPADRADAAPLQAVNVGSYATTTAPLNLRTGPGSTYAVQLLLPTGAYVYVNGGPYNSVWYDVTYNGRNGFAHGGYLVAASAPPVRTGAFALTTAVLNLRSGPGTGYTILLSIPQGARVFVSNGPYNGVWFQATYNNVSGYVHGSYLAKGTSALVQRLNTSQPIVALTFDAGSDVGYTVQILDTLKANGVKASFGMTGNWANANPALVQRMIHDGHMIINHTYSHPSFTGRSTGKAPLTYTQRANELWNNERLMLQLTNTSTKPYFRPPYGDYDNGVLVDVWSRGYSYTVMWSCDSLGWKGLTKDQIVQRVVANLQPGAIYLFHVGSQSQDGPALQSIIDALRARGYRFAKINDYYR